MQFLDKFQKTEKKYQNLGRISNISKLSAVLNLLKIMVISSYVHALKFLQMEI